MAVRIGIELSPAACRIVALDGQAAWRRDTSETRVLSFAALPSATGATTAKLASLRGRRASVVVWGVRTDYRQVVVKPGPYERRRLEARARLREAGLPTQGTLSDIAPAEPRVAGMDRRSVLLASAPSAEVMTVLGPLVDAGVKIGAVLLPAAALQSLARTRRSTAVPDALEAYVALEETASCIAVIRDGVLLAARDLPWGYLADLSGPRPPRARHDIAVRLADEIASFLAACRFDGKPLAQVSICGGLPELRSMTVPLMERLDVEVETLDSLFAIDPVRLPEPADEFRERAADMRLAWAAAADRRPALDLFRNRRRRVMKTHLSRAAVVAGAAAGLGAGWWLQNQWRPPVKPVQRVASASVPEVPRHPTAPAVARAVTVTNQPTPPPERLLPPRKLIAAPSATLVKAIAQPPVAAAQPVMISPPAPRPFVAPPPAPPSPRLALAAAPPPRVSLIPVRVEMKAPLPIQASALPPRVMPAVAVAPIVRRDVQRETPRPIEETALPFDAALETILYGSDRKLAIVDGRIVQVGDDVKDARVVEITPTALLLRDAQGRLRRLSVGIAGR